MFAQFVIDFEPPNGSKSNQKSIQNRSRNSQAIFGDIFGPKATEKFSAILCQEYFLPEPPKGLQSDQIMVPKLLPNWSK